MRGVQLGRLEAHRAEIEAVFAKHWRRLQFTFWHYLLETPVQQELVHGLTAAQFHQFVQDCNLDRSVIEQESAVFAAAEARPSDKQQGQTERGLLLPQWLAALVQLSSRVSPSPQAPHEASRGVADALSALISDHVETAHYLRLDGLSVALQLCKPLSAVCVTRKRKLHSAYRKFSQAIPIRAVTIQAIII